MLLTACTSSSSPPHAQASRIYHVAIMTADSPVWRGWADAFRDGMRELGYVEGRDLVIEEVPVDTEDLDATLALIERLKRDRVDALVSAILPHHIAAVAAAAYPMPLVESLLNSPNVGVPPVASYAHPGANFTGIIAIDVDQHARRLQLLKEIAPGVSRVILLTPWDRPADLPGWSELADMARTLNVDLERVQPSGPDDIEPALEAAIQRGADGFLLYQGNPFGDEAVRRRVIDVVNRHGLPAAYIDLGWARMGGLMAYGPNSLANYRRAATYVDRILKGAKAADLPIEQPAKQDLVVNIKTADALGLAVPPSVLAQVSELIQ